MSVPKKIITRQVFDCPIFGSPKDFSSNKLPTAEDVIRCCSQERYDLALKVNNKKVSFTQVVGTVANKVIDLYQKASIPTVTYERIVQLINVLHEKYYSLRKSYTRDKNKNSFKEKIDKFKRKCSNLFDVAACKCPIVVNCICNKIPDLCKCDISVSCNCAKSNKIPVIELRFLYLLRAHGIGKIGSVDLSETKKLNKSFERRSRDSHLTLNDGSESTSNMKPSCLHSNVKVVEIDDEDQHPSSKDNDSDQDFKVPKRISSNTSQMRLQLKSTALLSDRYGVSDRATAAIASSVHFNELPFRHLFQYLDGKSTGPKSFRGPIGEKLNGCEKRPVIGFKSIDCQIPTIDRSILSKDQQYLLDISIAIKSGKCEEDLAVRNPGPLSHSRWLTAANRTLRLYLSEESPTPELKEIVVFILKSYMPIWFNIKTSKYFTEGPKLVYQSIQSSKYLPEDLLNIVNPVIERNGFFAHPEHLIITMTQDNRKHIRELGLRRILKARELDQKRTTIRTFMPPKLNFNSQDYSEIINWMDCDLSSPPLLKDISDNEIKSHIQSDSIPNWDITFKTFPVHTQAVESCVKLVTEATSKVCGAESRDGFIRTTLLSRSIMPNFTHKSDFKVSSAKDE